MCVIMSSCHRPLVVDLVLFANFVNWRYPDGPDLLLGQRHLDAYSENGINGPGKIASTASDYSNVLVSCFHSRFG